MSGGVDASVIPRKYVKVQSTQPTSAVQGDLWVDSDDNALYQYTGSTWQTVTQDIGYLNLQQLQQSIAILALQANASLSPADYDTMFLDKFTDTSGYDNTIDTGNTTATYITSTKEYSNGVYEIDAHGQSLTSDGADTMARGCRITVDEVCDLHSITKHSSVDATRCQLLDNGGSNIATATFIGDVATFSTPQSLSTGTNYHIVLDKNGSSYANYRTGVAPFPVQVGLINFTYGYPTDVPDRIYNFVSLTLQKTPVNKIIQTNTITLDADASNYLLFANNSIAGTGFAQFKISFDDGSTWSDAKELNTKYTNSTTGTSVKLQILLNGTGAGNTSSASDYALMIW